MIFSFPYFLKVPVYNILPLGCTPSVEPVGRMAASWNILIMITLGTDTMFDSERDFPTMIRMSIAQSKFAKFYLEFFKLYSWTDIAVFYDQNAVFCPRWREALEPLLATNGISPTVFKMRSIATGLFEYEEILKEARKISRGKVRETGTRYIILFCTRSI